MLLKSLTLILRVSDFSQHQSREFNLVAIYY